MEIIMKKVEELIPYENNPRINDASIEAVANSIKEFGFKVPIVVDDGNVIITGHTRLKAAKQLGLDEVPVIIASDLDAEQVKAFRVADNSAGSNSEWEWNKLKKEIDGLKDFDFSNFGLSLEEVKINTMPTRVLDLKPPKKDSDIKHDSKITLYNGDCLEEMKKITDKSIDMILVDPPYGILDGLEWDKVIPFDKLWEQYNRILKDDGQVLIFGDGALFSTKVILSNEKMFKYNWYWKKTKAVGFQNAKKQPLREIEVIHVFYKKYRYNPQLVQGEPWASGPKNPNIRPPSRQLRRENSGLYSTRQENPSGLRYPANLLEFNSVVKPGSHPTQKPVDLLKYLIRTYTDEGMLVLDNCMGSGSTGVAAKELGRDFIGIELNKDYFEMAKGRING